MAYKYPCGNEEKEIKREKLPTNRSMLKLMILSILTFEIYGVVFFIRLSFELDKISPESSGQMNYLCAYLLALFTLAIVLDFWHYQTAKRINEALSDREIEYEFGTGDFFHKLCKATHLLFEHYNENQAV